MVTREMKETIVEAFTQIGEDGKGKGGRVGYLKWFAEDTKSMAKQLFPLIHLQAKAHPSKKAGYEKPDEIRAAPREHGLAAMAEPSLSDRAQHAECGREASQRPGRFQKGHKKLGGRKRGTLNRMTSELMEEILEALAQSGEDGKGKGGISGCIRRAGKDK